MSNEQKPGDPADKGADQFVSHRAGYGHDKLARLIDWVRQRPSATLASGEGALLLAEIDRLHAAELDGMDHYADARAEVDRLREQLHLADQSARSSSAEAARLGRILAALREPSEALVEAVAKAQEPRLWPMLSASVRALRRQSANRILRAAVAAAEQEVGRE